jgi:TetR/AcrR family transcriptional regulator
MGRNPEQNERARAEREKQILDAALRLFATRGLGTTRITDIAREAGISQGLVYHYFDSKESIYVELIGGAFQRLEEAGWGLAVAGATAREQVALALERLLADVERDERFAHHVLLIAQAGISDGVPEEAKAVIRRHQDGPYDVMAEVFSAGQREGSVRAHDVHDLAVLFWSIIRGLALYRAGRGRVFGRSGADLLKEVFLKD